MFGSYYGGSRDKDPEVRRLEQQIDDMRYEQERERDKQRDERKRMMEERRQEARDRELYADNWEDGFGKCIRRARQEASEERVLNERMKADPDLAGMAMDDGFFDKWADRVEKAQQMYTAEMKHVEEVIERYRRMALVGLAERIEKELDDAELAQAMRENNPSYLTNW